LVDREMFAAELQRERELRDEALGHQRRAEELARTLQRSLSPPRLPAIDGLDVAVHYEPSAPEEVGGDFYDLFPLARHRAGFFLGDVCGKGPEAAAVTSLARYTMRTAAMLHEEPAAILADLNTALLMHRTGRIETCTAVYGQIDISTPGAGVTLAVAGHPPPLVVREDGSIEPTAARGTMLGAVEDPAFHTCELTLARGDAIVICSDGIQDTCLSGIRVDEQHVAQLLSGTSRASAQELVDRLMDALQEVDRPLRDDVAIMALRRTPPV
jgi:sigma-B regulation protein RsbU (phosphoserine phosphatase)